MAPTLTPIPQDAFVAAIAVLADRIGVSSWQPEMLVGIGRGGLVPAVYLSHALGLPMLSVDFSAGDADVTAPALLMLSARAKAGTRLLVIDDINDTGRTLGQIRQALAEGGAPAEKVRFAALIDNVRSGERIDFSARQIDRAITKDWFVFPWEAVAPVSTIVQDAAVVPERIA